MSTSLLLLWVQAKKRAYRRYADLSSPRPGGCSRFARTSRSLHAAAIALRSPRDRTMRTAGPSAIDDADGRRSLSREAPVIGRRGVSSNGFDSRRQAWPRRRGLRGKSARRAFVARTACEGWPAPVRARLGDRSRTIHRFGDRLSMPIDDTAAEYAHRTAHCRLPTRCHARRGRLGPSLARRGVGRPSLRGPSMFVMPVPRALAPLVA